METMKPEALSALDVAFPASVLRLMPKYDEIPREFKNGSTKWSRLVSDWFFRGVRIIDAKPKEGIDRTAALRHVSAIMGSFEPQHEHKEASAAYLLSEWFDDLTWEVRKGREG